jgi:MOSC domain-containing protein YiiM
VLSPEAGVPGDGWLRRPPRDPQAQLAVMRRDLAELLANSQPLTLFGDNLFVDLDLPPRASAGHVRVVGDPLVTRSPQRVPQVQGPFGGMRALRAAPPTRHQNLRGIYWKVVEPGEAGVGDPIEVLSRG